VLGWIAFGFDASGGARNGVVIRETDPPEPSVPQASFGFEKVVLVSSYLQTLLLDASPDC